ncbi:MAG: DNA repair protein RecO [Sphingobacteriales bacterium]|jgi:DNA repair protein RecO (recombination protein O)|nr:MAG: DNA repair protein RecO [Sphingobacteriales bacterium]
MLEKTEGIVLKTIKYGESSLIVKLFTEKFGLIPILFKGIRTNKNKEANIFQPGFIIDVSIYFKENKNILLSKERNINYVYKSITNNMSKLSIVYFIVEIILHCTKEQQINTEEYQYLKEFLLQIDNETENLENYPLIFMYQLSAILGFKPMCFDDDENRYFNLEKGVFEEIPPQQQNIDAQKSKYLYHMLNTLDNQQKIKYTTTERQILLDIWINYYQYQITEFKKLNTPTILHQILHK